MLPVAMYFDLLAHGLTIILDEGARVAAAGSKAVGTTITTNDVEVATKFPPLNYLWGGVSSPIAEISEHGETNPQNTARSDTSDTRAEGDIAVSIGKVIMVVYGTLKPGINLGVHDAGTAEGGENWGWR